MRLLVHAVQFHLKGKSISSFLAAFLNDHHFNPTLLGCSMVNGSPCVFSLMLMAVAFPFKICDISFVCVSVSVFSLCEI